MEHSEFIKRLEGPIEQFVGVAREVCEGAIAAFHEFAEDMCESEIEKIFFVAYLLRLERYELFGASPGGRAAFSIARGEEPTWPLGPPLVDPIRQVDRIIAQLPVEGFRADFAVIRAERHSLESEPICTPIVLVECDGHDFHDRTKEQAARDKSRDRHLQSAGYYVLRFTGSEIWRNPAACASQVDEVLDNHITRLLADRRRAARNENAK